ncbi:hypothetical protein [Bordetella flabilis]
MVIPGQAFVGTTSGAMVLYQYAGQLYIGSDNAIDEYREVDIIPERPPGMPE